MKQEQIANPQMDDGLATLESRVQSSSKDVRLKALKLMLTHPDATPLQLARCLCSEDNRNFEFLEVYGLGAAMRSAWDRLAGIDDEDVYEFLGEVSVSDKSRLRVVAHVFRCINTSRALATLAELEKLHGPLN